MSADGKFINAFIFTWPQKGINIRQIKPAESSVIRLMGLDANLKWKYDEKNGLTVELPYQAELPCKYVWVLKIEGSEL